VRGFIAEVLKTIYSRMKRGGISGERYSKRRERGDCGGVMTDGTRLAVRERGVNWVGLVRGELGRLVPGYGPSGL
jgi:hypothetical protein